MECIVWLGRDRLEYTIRVEYGDNLDTYQYNSPLTTAQIAGWVQTCAPDCASVKIISDEIVSGNDVDRKKLSEILGVPVGVRELTSAAA
jgi:hypothetical protein